MIKYKAVHVFVTDAGYIKERLKYERTNISTYR
jgi:hypothetical protein